MTSTDLSSSPAHPTQTTTTESQPRSRSFTASQAPSDKHSPTPENDDETTVEQEYLFSCRCDSAKAISSLLSCLAGGESKKNAIQPVTVFCTPTALTFHVYASTAKQSQASVDINKGIFCDYQCKQGDFCINLTSVLECLSILGTYSQHTKLCWAFSPTTQTFEMELLEQGGVLSTAAIPGLSQNAENSPSLALAFSQSPIVSRILLKSDWLKQAWQELQSVSGCSVCTVAVSSTALQLATVGHAGECIVSLPATNQNQGSVLLSLECGNDNVARSYPLSSFKMGMRGLEIAQETCLTINKAGMMAIQHQVLSEVGDGEANFVDFLMACLETEEDEDEQEEGDSNTTRREPPQPTLSLGWKSQQDDDKEQQDSQDSESDEDDTQLPPPISNAPLFGTVVDEEASTRSVRRRRPTSSSVPSSSIADNDHSSSSEDEQPLDVTASMTDRRRRCRRRRGSHHAGRDAREEGASSPEIGYGDDDDE